MPPYLLDKELVKERPIFTLSTVNELRRRKAIPYLQLPGIRKFFYDLSEVDKWLAGRQVQPVEHKK